MGGQLLQFANVECARVDRNALIKHDQAEQENETSGREIDRDFPGRGLPVAGPPDSDEQKSRDQRELVKGVEEKQIERSECSHGAAGNEEKAGVEGVLVLRDFTGEPDRGQGHDRGQQHHDQAQAIEADGEVEVPVGRNRERTDILENSRSTHRTKEGGQAKSKFAGSEQRGGARRRADHDQQRRTIGQGK